MDTGNDNKWKGRRKDRDDTPSFIRNVDLQNELLKARNSSSNSIPVLSIPAKIKIWQQVRWPLLIAAVLIVLVAVGFFTNDILVARNLEKRINDASIGEKTAHVGVMLESNKILANMADRYSDRLNVQIAYAWSSALISKIFDMDKIILSDAGPSFDAIAGDVSPLGYAARGTKLLLDGKTDEALSLIKSALKLYPDEPRLYLVNSWANYDKGNKESALKIVKKLRADYPDYLPALYTLIDIGLDSRDKSLVAKSSSELMIASSGNIYAAIASLMVKLPAWNEEPLSPELTSVIQSSAISLSGKLNDAPEKIKVYGLYLLGRIYFESHNYKKAIDVFKKIMPDRYDLKTVAWYSRTVLENSGPKEALKLLDSVDNSGCNEIQDIKARCYLKLYQLADAEKALNQLKKSPVFDVTELNWILAVRKGNVLEAAKLLPQRISSWDKDVALEMYELLQAAGMASDIKSFIKSTAKSLPLLAEAVALWHSDNSSKAVEYFKASVDETVLALALRVLNNNFPPDVLNEILKPVVKSTTLGLRVKVDIARAVWKIDGREAALKVVSSMDNLKIESPMFLYSLAKLYSDMGLNEKALNIVKEIDFPECVALKIEIIKKLQKPKQVKDALKKVFENSSINQEHPAIVYLQMENKYENGDIQGVIEDAEKVIDHAGVWTSEISELASMAMNTAGGRGEVDRYLQTISQDVIAKSGIGESWKVQENIINLNLRRGGKFIFKATETILNMLKNDKVPDPAIWYSHGLISAREGNVRGAIRYFNEALDLNPAFLPAYEQLNIIAEISVERLEKLSKIWPGFKFPPK
ncbi:MAG: hypothetical protein JXR91_17015 [Deltaproteobacteria bacterium]|nr:hypothetical protein [Deltaproteobacteria bacterium]